MKIMISFHRDATALLICLMNDRNKIEITSRDVVSDMVALTQIIPAIVPRATRT